MSIIPTQQNESFSDINRRIALNVMGWMEWNPDDGDWNGPEGATFFALWDEGLSVYENGAEEPTMYFDPARDIASAWLVVELMTSRMGYDGKGFFWQGPLFKPEHHYLTAEGYPLGTTCWYVTIEADGLRKIICADTAMLAVCKAAEKVIELMPRPVPRAGERNNNHENH